MSEPCAVLRKKDGEFEVRYDKWLGSGCFQLAAGSERFLTRVEASTRVVPLEYLASAMHGLMVDFDTKSMQLFGFHATAW